MGGRGGRSNRWDGEIAELAQQRDAEAARSKRWEGRREVGGKSGAWSPGVPDSQVRHLVEGLSTYLCVPVASFAHTRPVVMSRIAILDDLSRAFFYEKR